MVQWHHNATVRKCDLEKLLKERFVSSYSYTKTNISYHAWRNYRRLAMDCFHVSKCQKRDEYIFIACSGNVELQVSVLRSDQSRIAVYVEVMF